MASLMTSSITLFFDVASPYCFVAHAILLRYQDILGINIHLVPVSLPLLFELSGNRLPERACPNKQAYTRRDLESYADFAQVSLHSTEDYKHETRLAQSLLVLLKAKHPAQFQECLLALWESAQENGKDVSNQQILGDLIDEVFISSKHAPSSGQMVQEAMKYSNILEKNTHQAYEEGAYGLPYMTTTHHETGEFMGFFGCGRIEMALASLGIHYQGPAPTIRSLTKARKSGRMQFAFDVLSPYAYFAHKIIQRYVRAWNIDIDYIPVHMPTVFQESGNHGPIYGCENKKLYTLKDLPLLAKHFDVPLRIPDKFPCNTVPCQALLLIIKERCPSNYLSAIDLLWDATLCQNLDVEDSQVVLGVLQPIFSPSIPLHDWVKESFQPIAVDRILQATRSLVLNHKAHGLPYFICHSHNTVQHFFGSDRVDAMAHFFNLPYSGPTPTDSTPLG